jgi:pantothenate kinase type III
MAQRNALLLLVGNTSLRWRVARGDAFVDGGVAPGAGPLPDALRAVAETCDVFACSVNPPALARARAALVVPLTVLGEGRPIPIANRTREPSRVGTDRLLAALGAWKRVGASIVVDAGTAITVDLVTEGPTFEGGAILPGPALCAEALNRRTALLPLVAIDRAPDTALGRDTEEAIRAGVYFGAAGGIAMIAERLRAGRDDIAMVVTGGAGMMLMSALPGNCVYDADLVFHGMAAAVERR